MKNYPLPFPTTRILVVSDFNCPYCYTLNEWIEALGMSDHVRWVGIEHRPSLPSAGANSNEERRTMTTEVEDVRQRAPEVGAQSPPLWSNSNAAVALQNAVEVDHPDRSSELRLRIFRAYWQDGVLLSKPGFLTGLCDELGIPPVDLDTEELEELTEWWARDIDRIPCMLAPTGVAHLGLQDRQSVQTFLNAAIHTTDAGPGCRSGAGDR